MKNFIDEIEKMDVPDINVGNISKRTPQLAIFDFRSFLDLAMLLVESQLAKSLRQIMLDIVIDFINQKAGGRTKYINQRDSQFLGAFLQEENYRREHVDLQHLYIDGSKFEANANKYSWVWKKATEKSRYRLFGKITTLFEEINEELSCTGMKLCINSEYAPEYLKESAEQYAEIWQINEVMFVHGRGHRKTTQQRHYEKLKEYAAKLEEYVEKIKICGEVNISH